MTQDELDALPETIDGVKPAGAIWQNEDDPMFIEDRHGRVWSVGWVRGVRFKRHRPEYDLLRK